MLEKILAGFPPFPPHLHRHVLQCWTFRHRRAPATEEEQRRAVYDYLTRTAKDPGGRARIHASDALVEWLNGPDERSRGFGPVPRLAALMREFAPDLRRRYDLRVERDYKACLCHLALSVQSALRWPEVIVGDAPRRVLWESAPGVRSPSRVGLTRAMMHVARNTSGRRLDVASFADYSQLLLGMLADIENGRLPAYALSPEQVAYLSTPLALRGSRIRMTGLMHHLAVERGMVTEQDLARPDVATQLAQQFRPLLARMTLPGAIREAHAGAPATAVAIVPAGGAKPAEIVTVVGPLGHGSGLGAASRACVDALRAASVPFEVLNLRASWGSNAEAPGEGFVDRIRGDINVIHFNPDVFIENISGFGLEQFEGRYNVGMFWWETSKACFAHRLGADLLDEVWVATPYLRDVFAAVTDKPVHVVGMAVPRIADVGWASRRYFELPEEAFTFVFTFDGASRFTRKNPLGAVEAFQRAFPREDDVRLVIKTHNTGALGRLDRRLYAEIRRRVAADHRIVVIDEPFTSNEVHALIAVCDAYVGLQRSEGFGLGMAEAMALRVPVIATADSGNAVFTTEETSWPVRCSRIPVTAEEFVYDDPGQEWAEPDLDHAAERMREVRAGTGREQKVARAHERMTHEYGAATVGKVCRERIADIRARLAAGAVVARAA